MEGYENFIQIVYNNENITKALREWLRKICIFCEFLGLKSDDSIGTFFVTFPNDLQKKGMYGYCDLDIRLLQRMINENVPQRVLLTTIYRFSKHFAGLLWRAIELTEGSKTMQEFLNIFQNVLDADELSMHANFVLQKHGMEFSESEDPIKALYKTFFDTRYGINIYEANTYPSIMTSLTQPVGNDPVSSWMMYGGSQAVRITPQPHSVRPDIKEDHLQPRFEREAGSIAQWITGSSLYKVNEKSLFYKLAMKSNKDVLTGPSCTTQMMLDCALLFGIDIKLVLLAIIPWMVVPKDHTIFEILIVANSYLTDHEYKVDKHDEVYLIEILQSLGMTGGKIDRRNKNKKQITRMTKANTVTGGEPPMAQPSVCTPLNIPCMLADTWMPPNTYRNVKAINYNAGRSLFASLPSPLEPKREQLWQIANAYQAPATVPFTKTMSSRRPNGISNVFDDAPRPSFAAMAAGGKMKNNRRTKVKSSKFENTI